MGVLSVFISFSTFLLSRYGAPPIHAATARDSWPQVCSALVNCIHTMRFNINIYRFFALFRESNSIYFKMESLHSLLQTGSPTVSWRDLRAALALQTQLDGATHKRPCASLQNGELWKQFYRNTNEMIVTRVGRYNYMGQLY